MKRVSSWTQVLRRQKNSDEHVIKSFKYVNMICAKYLYFLIRNKDYIYLKAGSHVYKVIPSRGPHFGLSELPGNFVPKITLAFDS